MEQHVLSYKGVCFIHGIGSSTLCVCEEESLVCEGIVLLEGGRG